MSLTFGFYNSINGDRVYDAIQMGQIFDGIITDGIYATYLKAMVVKASDNASEVIVQPGRAWFNHTWTYIDADYPVEAPAPEVILDRVDTLVLDINAEYSDRENKIIWVQGSPASVNPEAPSLTNTTTHHQYPLCNVYRKAGTTMIYAADITNRVGTSDTPFVTGVLTGINIDDLLSQWDDEFHTWENNTKTSFEAWMFNQQSVYTTWFESIRTQMSDDLTSFEEWFETIRGIIDEEVATHLQAEIDELKDMLPAGSHIDISTNESTLFNRNVTVSDGVHSKTVQFNAVGGATVESFPYIGSISVTSTDGERTASEVINIPYFGRYSVVLAFWSATVNLVGDSAVGGVSVTVKDSDDLTITTIVLNASGSGTFTATKPDTYKFIYTYGGQTMETTLQVTQETTYEVEIHGGLNYQAWLTAGRVSETFTSLDDILADEETLRQLMLVHDAVDYICNTFNADSTADVTKIFNTDLAAKWVNNSDYALDHFYAVSDIKSIMDTADKYGYGEWVITDDTTTPPTWGPKGNVPVMTANTAPYGEASASASPSATYYPYKAFDGDDSTFWTSGNTSGSTAQHITYAFTNPICPKRCAVKFTSQVTSTTVTISGSNDGTTWTDIETSKVLTGGGFHSFDLTCDDYYLQLKFTITFQTRVSQNDTVGQMYSLQYYGRELKVSIPAMTSNTAPYGEAFSNNSQTNSWKTFDGDTSTHWTPLSNATNNYVGYRFVTPVIIKYIKATVTHKTGYPTRTYTIQGSSDNVEFVDLYSFNATTTVKKVSANINNENEYSYFRIFCAQALHVPDSYIAGIEELQCYGLDYSEKEFEEGTTKKWLYDHGVELETLTITGTGTKNDDCIQLTADNSQALAAIDTTDYSLMRGKVGAHASGTNQLLCGSGSSNFTASNMPYNNGLDVSSINGSNAVGVKQTAAGVFDTTELWLE